jgi:hypothetical protein
MADAPALLVKYIITLLYTHNRGFFLFACFLLLLKGPGRRTEPVAKRRRRVVTRAELKALSKALSKAELLEFLTFSTSPNLILYLCPSRTHSRAPIALHLVVHLLSGLSGCLQPDNLPDNQADNQADNATRC